MRFRAVVLRTWFTIGELAAAAGELAAGAGKLAAAADTDES